MNHIEKGKHFEPQLYLVQFIYDLNYINLNFFDKPLPMNHIYLLKTRKLLEKKVKNILSFNTSVQNCKDELQIRNWLSHVSSRSFQLMFSLVIGVNISYIFYLWWTWLCLGQTLILISYLLTIFISFNIFRCKFT